jgi:EF-P beta-lysylation protein EpmB
MRDSSNQWQQILAQGFRSASDLLNFLELPAERASVSAEQLFKTRVPRGFALRMQKRNPSDPLLLQVLATAKELEQTVGYTNDPLQENRVNPVKGLLHKYKGRVLMTITGRCAVNCRYCFRRHFPYDENNPGRAGWQSALDYIASDSEIHEVILSGGDPLLASDSYLAELIERLENISHLKTLRIHSRIPVVLPERIFSDLPSLLKGSRFNVVLVIHSNHPQEIDDKVASACLALREANCHLLNQSVLLAGINDDVAVLAALSKKLFSIQVLPYYLHLLDKVNAAAHFDIPLAKAKQIYHQLQQELSGYLLPRLSCEISGEKSKTLII